MGIFIDVPFWPHCSNVYILLNLISVCWKYMRESVEATPLGNLLLIKFFENGFTPLLELCKNMSQMPILRRCTETKILSPVPFDTWAIDIMGPFPPVAGNIHFLLVAVDYMTKWVDSKTVAHVTAVFCRKFLHGYIITCFGIPRILITDNGH